MGNDCCCWRSNEEVLTYSMLTGDKDFDPQGDPTSGPYSTFWKYGSGSEDPSFHKNEQQKQDYYYDSSV